MKLAVTVASMLLLAGCAAGPTSLEASFPPARTTELAFPTLAACREATRGDADRSCVRIDFARAMSRVLVVRGLEVEVDGALVYARLEPDGGRGDLDLTQTFTLFLAPAAAGEHEVRVGALLLVDPSVDPSARIGKVALCSRQLFTVPAGAAYNLTIFLGEDWDRRIPLEKRISVGYREDRDGRQGGVHLNPRVGEGGQCPGGASK